MKRLSTTVLVITLFISCKMQAQVGFIKIKSENSVEATTAKLTTILLKKGMTIFSTIDHQQGALKAGLELPPTTLVIFGNPKVGTKLMQCDQKIGAVLPLKILIWEDTDGIVWLGYPNPDQLTDQYALDDCKDVVEKIKNAMANFTMGAASS